MRKAWNLEIMEEVMKARYVSAYLNAAPSKNEAVFVQPIKCEYCGQDDWVTRRDETWCRGCGAEKPVPQLALLDLGRSNPFGREFRGVPIAECEEDAIYSVWKPCGASDELILDVLENGELLSLRVLGKNLEGISTWDQLGIEKESVAGPEAGRIMDIMQNWRPSFG